MTLKWTKATPTEPGWYWVRSKTASGIALVRRGVGRSQPWKVHYLTHTQLLRDAIKTESREWAGPIPEPEEDE